ncbi:MAG TPA: hypothetical protein VMO47_04050 [Rhodothermales bacterium]|nr:hypothetical protein [Rhodothermales bacterium]
MSTLPSGIHLVDFAGLHQYLGCFGFMGLRLETGEVTNYTNSPAYEEPEGIFPDGMHTLVESDRHGGGGDSHIDLYKLALDGSGTMQRLTYFSDTPGYKASNPVVSDDGRYIAFQMARSADMPGVGRGLFLYDTARAPEPLSH